MLASDLLNHGLDLIIYYDDHLAGLFLLLVRDQAELGML